MLESSTLSCNLEQDKENGDDLPPPQVPMPKRQRTFADPALALLEI